MVLSPLIVASYCKLLTSSNNNHLASTATFLRDLDTRLDSLEKEAVEQLIQQLQEVPCTMLCYSQCCGSGSGIRCLFDRGSGIRNRFFLIPNFGSRIPNLGSRISNPYF